jgi:hypothetical protein
MRFASRDDVCTKNTHRLRIDALSVCAFVSAPISARTRELDRNGASEQSSVPFISFGICRFTARAAKILCIERVRAIVRRSRYCAEEITVLVADLEPVNAAGNNATSCRIR